MYYYKTKLIDTINYNNDDESIAIQKKYSIILDKIIDGILSIRYDTEKMDNRFYSADNINRYLLHKFKVIKKKKERIENIVLDIVIATKRVDKKKHYEKEINRLYNLFIDNSNLSKEETTSLFNEILNDEQNYYMSTRKNEIKISLVKKFDLSTKKNNNLVYRAKIKHEVNLLKKGIILSIGLQEEDLIKDLENLHNTINNNWLFKKNNIVITKNQFKILDKLFLTGNLDKNHLAESFPFITSNISKKIIHKYSKILLQYVNKVPNEDVKIDYSDIDFNYNNIKIFDKQRYNKNIKIFINSLDEDEIMYIIENYKSLEELFKLLNFIDIDVNFDIDVFKSIIFNIDNIKKSISKRKPITNINLEIILDNFKDVINLANIYSSCDKYTIATLKEENINIIISTISQTSNNPLSYINIYNNMLKNTDILIPPIEGYYKEFYYESGNNYSLDKLLIGKRIKGSCIGPDGAGSDAYFEVLTKNSADVLIIREKETKKFVARTLMFRRGNFVVMAPIVTIDEFDRSKLFNEEFLKHISNQLLEESLKAEDNLDYVFMSYEDQDKGLNLITHISDDFWKEVPHCDTTNMAYLLASKHNIIINPKTFKIPKAIYKNKRMKILIKDSEKQDILRIKSMQLFMEEDIYSRINIGKEFERIENTNYIKTYVGQDFYIAINEFYEIESCILETNDERKYEEINIILKEITNSFNNLIKKEEIDIQKVLKKKL